MLGDICPGPDGGGGGRMNYFLVVGPHWNIKIFPTKFVCAANIGRAPPSYCSFASSQHNINAE